ncbi:MAG: hypothetical protein HY906_17665 [Deltaproteobacteria bacterium]|nr:hypothetical protein [Deltaproteobacteria bacterium]
MRCPPAIFLCAACLLCAAGCGGAVAANGDGGDLADGAPTDAASGDATGDDAGGDGALAHGPGGE